MATTPETKPEHDSALRRWLLRATGVLLVVPALINAAYDVYATALKLPRTDAERVNSELFRKYFNKPPLALMPVPVKNGDGTVEARFSIYEEGEIYVEFGKLSQWFPFPRTQPQAHTGFSLLPAAHAQPVPAAPMVVPPRVVSQTDRLEGNVLVRTLVRADGRTETRRIDIRTGTTLGVEHGSGPALPSAQPAPRTFKVEAIDVQALKVGKSPD